MIDKEIKSKENCMGCYACESICPTKCIIMKKDQEGFRYPEVDIVNCIKCEKCIEVCPIINKLIVKNDPKAYACINNDETTRMKSSSGGIFTLFAEQIIDTGGIVFGAAFDKMHCLKHIYVENKKDLELLRGSKYVQSQIEDSYIQAKHFLDYGKEVLFSGTPCQVAGLKSFLKNPYNNLTTIDLICHGVPSPDVWSEYILLRETRSGSQVKKISFRRKEQGWKQYHVSFVFKNNEEYLEKFKNDLYMRAFLKDVCLRPSCYACEFKTLNRQSDITLGDFWGIQNLCPEMDDDKGTSLIFVNSELGKATFERLQSKMQYQEVKMNEAVKYNLSAIKSVLPNLNRDNFFSDLGDLPFDKLVERYCNDKSKRFVE